MPYDEDTPLRTAILRIIAVLVAAVLITIGLFDESIVYALTVGLILGIGFAAAAYTWTRLKTTP